MQPAGPVKFTSLPAGGQIQVISIVDGTLVSQTAREDVWYPSLYWQYVPNISGALDEFTYVQQIGPFLGKPATIKIGDVKGHEDFYFTVANDQAASYATDYKVRRSSDLAEMDITFSVAERPTHGKCNNQQ